MQKYIVYATHAWLAFIGVSHFIADVVSQMIRGKHSVGPETTLYYGLHSSYAWGQNVLGTLRLYLTWRAFEFASSAPVLLIAVIAGFGWLGITFLYMPYWEPKLTVGIFCTLALAALAFCYR